MLSTPRLVCIEAMTSFAYDTNIIACNKIIVNLIIDMQKSLEAITQNDKDNQA